MHDALFMSRRLKFREQLVQFACYDAHLAYCDSLCILRQFLRLALTGNRNEFSQTIPCTFHNHSLIFSEVIPWNDVESLSSVGQNFDDILERPFRHPVQLIHRLKITAVFHGVAHQQLRQLLGFSPSNRQIVGIGLFVQMLLCIYDGEGAGNRSNRSYRLHPRRGGTRVRGRMKVVKGARPTHNATDHKQPNSYEVFHA